MNWYTLKVFSGKEKKIQDTIIREVEQDSYTDIIGQVLVPSENVIEMRKGKKIMKDRVFFPGYILIEMEMNRETKHLIEMISGVISFAGPKGLPQPLREEEINRILGEVERKEGREVIASHFNIGDPIKVIDGPFIDFTGFVQETNEDKQKVKVSVSIFGRPTPVELDFLQVEHEK